MRPMLTILLLLALNAGLTACAKSSDSATASASSSAAAPSAAPAAPATPAAASEKGGPPVYPGASPATAPASVGSQAPAGVRAYATADDFATVQAWYRAHLKGAIETGAGSSEKTRDAFLIGASAKTGSVVMIQSAAGKTWILIGPP